MNTPTNIKDFMVELLKTLSGQKSFLSSKRIEKLILFSVAVGMCCTYFILHIRTIDVLDMLMIVGTLMVYAGFNLAKIESAKGKE